MTDRSLDSINSTFLTEYFSTIKDPRRTSKGNIKHKLTDILLLVLVSVLCRITDWDEMVDFGNHELDWFKKHGDFSNGIPSESTIRRVFLSLDPDSFSSCFTTWVYSLLGGRVRESISFDGKTIRGAKTKSDASSKSPHILSAVVSELGICLGQLKTEEKSNEITAIPELINSLSIEDCTVTIDAMGCHKNIVSSIIEAQANYVIGVKANQSGLLAAIKDTVALEKYDHIHIDQSCGHGRVEKRTANVYFNLSHYDKIAQWKDLKTFIAIEKETFNKATKKTTIDKRYYISNLNLTGEQANRIVRSHWAVENKLHWVLDVVFGEDASRKRKGYSAQNMNIVMKMALTLINNEKTFKKSKNRKRFKALIDRNYREKLLGFK